MRQENGIRTLVYGNNGKDTSGIRVNGKSISASINMGCPMELVVMLLVPMVSLINLLQHLSIDLGSYRGDRMGFLILIITKARGMWIMTGSDMIMGSEMGATFEIVFWTRFLI